MDESTSSTSTSTSSAVDTILAAAVANAADGIQSYSHGSRTVSRSSPRAQIELLRDIELRERRRQFGIWLNCNQGGK